MAFDPFIADRIHTFLKGQKVPYYAKNMMGGLVFMVDEKMYCGIHFDKKKNTDLLMARIGVDAQPVAMEREGCQPMDFTGRPLKGYVFITPDGYDSDEDLEYWLKLCLEFNPLAKASKKRTKK